jgi:hypothetical protein
MDEREREKFYSSNPDATGDDEYELEPLDPGVLSEKQRIAHETLDSSRASIDIDEIYSQAERDRGREIVESWLRGRRFQFQTKHLFIATAVVAILLALARLDLMILVVLGAMLAVAGVYLYFQWQERKHQAEADRRRQEMYARRRAQLGKKPLPGDPVLEKPEQPATPLDPLPPLQSEIDEIWEKARERREFQFRFSMQQLMATITAAAVIFGLVHLGGAEYAATLLGLIALAGLAIHAFGYDPPDVVVLGWWLILLLYVILSVVGFFWKSLA